jgi:hypothetical protein
VSDAQPPLAAGDSSPVRFWEAMMAAGPAVAAIAPPLAVWLAGGFDDFQWVDRQVTPAQTFGILGAMCFPLAAFFFAQGRFDQALARVSRTWPTTPGVIGSCEKRERWTRFGTVYRLSVSYSFRVGGIGYEGDTVEFGPAWVPDEALNRRVGAEIRSRHRGDGAFRPGGAGAGRARNRRGYGVPGHAQGVAPAGGPTRRHDPDGGGAAVSVSRAVPRERGIVASACD